MAIKVKAPTAPKPLFDSEKEVQSQTDFKGQTQKEFKGQSKMDAIRRRLLTAQGKNQFSQTLATFDHSDILTDNGGQGLLGTAADRIS